MKTLLLALILMFMSTAAVAEDEKKPRTFCDALSELAENVYDMRQLNVSLSDQLELGGEIPAIRSIILDAYKQPRFTTPEIVERAKREFADKWMLSCIEASE